MSEESGAPSATTTAPKFELLVGGQPVDPVLAESVILLRTHLHLELADCLEIRLSNDDLGWSEADTLAEGKEVALKLGYEGEEELAQVFKGEIVRRDCEFPVQGPAVVTVVAFDKEHRLKRGRVSKAWLDMKDSDVVSEIAGAVGLTADVEDTQVVHPYLFQQAQTNLAFIRERAALLDCVVDVDRENSKVSFKKAVDSSSVMTLKWGENLLAFASRMTTDAQVSKVIVRGWDMMAKAAIEGTAEDGDIRYLMGGADTGAALAKKTYGAREVLYADRPLFVAAEATALAQARLNQLSAGYTEGQASCQGTTEIEAGVKVTFEAVGERAGGDHFVTRVLHHFEPGVGFSTHFDFIRSTERMTAGEDRPVEEVPPREQEQQEQPGWVEITVRSETGESLEGVSYVVTLPNGQQQRGTFDATQTIRVEGIRDPGEAQIEFTPPEGLAELGGE